MESELAPPPESWTGLILGGERLKGLAAILHRGQTLESLLYAFVVVPVNIVIDRVVKLIQAGHGELEAAVELVFKARVHGLDLAGRDGLRKQFTRLCSRPC